MPTWLGTVSVNDTIESFLRKPLFVMQFQARRRQAISGYKIIGNILPPLVRDIVKVDYTNDF